MIANMADLRFGAAPTSKYRIGMAPADPVVGGVIGQRRLLFDIWGDAVNLASRMESSGVSGRIRDLSRHPVAARRPRGLEAREVDIKGFGQQTTYLVR